MVLTNDDKVAVRDRHPFNGLFQDNPSKPAPERLNISAFS